MKNENEISKLIEEYRVRLIQLRAANEIEFNQTTNDAVNRMQERYIVLKWVVGEGLL